MEFSGFLSTCKTQEVDKQIHDIRLKLINPIIYVGFLVLLCWCLFFIVVDVLHQSNYLISYLKKNKIYLLLAARSFLVINIHLYSYKYGARNFSDMRQPIFVKCPGIIEIHLNSIVVFITSIIT